MLPITISIINLKGGVGKSTLAMIFGEFLVFKYGKRVLLIDMDSQGNLSYCMVPSNQIDAQFRNNRTTYHLLKNAIMGKDVDVKEFVTTPPLLVSNIARSSAIHPPGIIDMIISHPSVAQLDEDLLQLWEENKPMPTDLRLALSYAIEPAIELYDYIIIDCPPGLSLFSSTSLMASNYYVSPIIPEPLSLQGVNLVQSRATELNEKYGHNIEFKGVILNIVKHYRNTHFRVSEALYNDNSYRYLPFNNWLPDNERIRKLGEFDPDMEGTRAGGFDVKFSTINEKYGLSYKLTNPLTGALNRFEEEGQKYRLEDRIGNLVEELIERCR